MRKTGRPLSTSSPIILRGTLSAIIRCPHGVRIGQSVRKKVPILRGIRNSYFDHIIKGRWEYIFLSSFHHRRIVEIPRGRAA